MAGLFFQNAEGNGRQRSCGGCLDQHGARRDVPGIRLPFAQVWTNVH
jgi:hypothetical protein